MDGRAALAKAFGEWADDSGYTQQQIATMGGPSTTTQTKVGYTNEPVSRQTMQRIDAVAGWEPGTSQRILRTGEVPVPKTVSGSTDDDDALLYRRPEGLTDRQWEAIKEETRPWIEYQIQRAAGER